MGYSPLAPGWGNHWGAVYGLALDPAGRPWLSLEACGGASCGNGLVRYYVTDGAWTQVGDLHGSSGLAFGADGTAWLCVDGSVYRLDREGDGYAAEWELLAELGAPYCRLEADQAGRVWLTVPGDEGLWVYVGK